ncbi:hypothetical protein HIM_08356 [Hirsutella minnesotensis 3608]|uniref:Uncharacterized protein n=1 Tax=Hirsutella minnesotensis 3608 TaxID=1043627 RepID=A0A0F8A3Q0_9HYPO|nr:hypothetical protein HIM_08356 [Hirsutella minnesotensis 3608]
MASVGSAPSTTSMYNNIDFDRIARPQSNASGEKEQDHSPAQEPVLGDESAEAPKETDAEPPGAASQHG